VGVDREKKERRRTKNRGAVLEKIDEQKKIDKEKRTRTKQRIEDQKRMRKGRNRGQHRERRTIVFYQQHC